MYSRDWATFDYKSAGKSINGDECLREYIIEPEASSCIRCVDMMRISTGIYSYENTSYKLKMYVILPSESRDKKKDIQESKLESLDGLFERLVRKWREERKFMSSIHDMAMTDSYQSIIGLGRDAVPLILRELKNRPDHWFWALKAITRQNPIKAEDAGNVKKMAQAWLELGDKQGWTL